MVTGPPQAPRDCVLSNETWYSLNVRCRPGFDGGFTQSFHLLAYETELPSPGGSGGGKFNSPIGSASERGELFVLNLTNTNSPEFFLNPLRSGVTYLLLVSSRNAKGSSPFQTLIGQTVAMLRQSSGTLKNINIFFQINTLNLIKIELIQVNTSALECLF